jgi:hypothetical protein
VETIKSSEPFSTVLIGLFLLSESYSMLTYLSLVPICLGVAVSCFNSEEGFVVMSFAMALASNFLFSARSVYTKQFNLSNNEKFDEINMFCYISFLGMVILIPIAALMEGGTLLSVAQAHLLSGVEPILPQDQGFFEFSAVTNGLLLLLLNGVMFAAYNLVSYKVAKETELVTHAVFNVCRRLFVIGFTSYYFNTAISNIAAFGIISATAGVLLFSYSRR